MLENPNTFFTEFMQQAEALARHPFIPAILIALLCVGLFLAFVWLKRQPQASFFHLALFQIGALAAVWFYAPKTLATPPDYVTLAAHLVLLAWLIFAPLDYGKTSNEQRFKDVFHKRVLWLLASVLFVSFAGVADYFFPQKPSLAGSQSQPAIAAPNADSLTAATGTEQNSPPRFLEEPHVLIWCLGVAALLVIAGFTAAPKFKKAWDEALAFALVLLSFICVSWLYNFTASPFALLTAVPGAAFLIIFTLLYHNRFIQNETELREGLLEQNQALYKTNEAHESLLSHMREAILHLDRDEKILFANAVFEGLPGVKQGNIQGENLRAALSKTFYDSLARALNNAKNGRDETFEINLSNPKNDVLRLNVRSEPLFDHREKVRGVHFSFFDLTELIEAQNNLSKKLGQQKQDLEFFRTALDNTEAGIVITGADDRIVFVNRVFCTMMGRRAKDLIGENMRVYRQETKAGRDALKVLQKGKTWRGTLRNRGRDGNEFEVDVYAAPLSFGGASSPHFLWVERDASARLHRAKTEEEIQVALVSQKSALTQELAEQQSILGALQTGIIFVPPEGACRILNADASAILGFSSENISLKKLPSFVADLLRLEASHSGKLHSEAHDFIDDFLRPDGVKKHLRWHAAPVSAPSGKFIGVALQVFDLTDQRARAHRLKALEDQLTSTKKQPFLDNGENGLLQQIINLAETVHANQPFMQKIQAVLRTSANIGWPRLLIYEKQSGQNAYFALDARGFGAEIKSKLLRIDAPDIERYFQTRFSLGAGFFLRASKSRATKMWDFWPSRQLQPATAGDWQPHDFFLLPLQQNDEQFGLMLFGAPKKGRLPTEAALEILEKLATQAASVIRQERRKKEAETIRKRNDVLIEISKMERFDVTPDREITRFLDKAEKVLQGEIGMVVYGAPPLGASTHIDKNKHAKAAMFGKARLEKILECEKTIMPSGGAKVIALESAHSPLATALGLPPIRKNPVHVIAARLTMNRRKHGFIYCWLPDKTAYTKALRDFFSEIAASLALVLENTRLFSETESKARDLEDANRHISEFLSNVSHELRTPLNVILRYAELLQERKNILEKDRLRHLQTIRTSGDNLLGLINDLLDMSKIEAGKFEPNPETFSPREVFQATEDAIKPLCEKSGLNLRIRVDKSVPPYVLTDKSMLSRTLLNLARNAQKFTPSGAVEISAVFLDRKVLKIQVRDTGPGIPRDKLEEIFKPFQQVDRTASRQFEGTGLGLPISRGMIELLGGKLDVRSKVGAGATFTIMLPLKGVWRKPRAEAASDETQAAQSKRSARKKSAHILLVDDNRSTEEAMRFFIENAGHKVDFAYDGRSAISLAHKLRPDLIFLDIMMPGMDGYEVVRILKAQKQLRDIPVVALTAHAMAEERKKAKAAGYDDFLSKPFEMKTFWQKVAANLK